MRKLSILLLSLLLCLPVMGQVRQISSAPFTGGVLTSALRLPDGSVGAPGYAFASDADTGFYRVASGAIGFASDGDNPSAFGSGSFQMGQSVILAWTGSTGAIAALDTGLARASAGVVKLTDGSTGGGALNLLPITAPAAPASGAVLYIDSADSDLKIKYSDGTVVVIGNKP